MIQIDIIKIETEIETGDLVKRKDGENLFGIYIGCIGGLHCVKAVDCDYALYEYHTFECLVNIWKKYYGEIRIKNSDI